MNRKTIWGIAGWFFGILAFFLTAGIIAAYIILEQIALATNSHATLFDEWYQTLMFVVDIPVVLGFILSIVMQVICIARGEGDGRGIFCSIFSPVRWGGMTSFVALLLVVVNIGSTIAAQYSANINEVLGIDIYKRVETGATNENTNYFPSDFYYSDGSFNDIAMREHSLAIAEEAANESTVLLWNNGNALPLAKDDNVGLFGITQRTEKYFYTGTGSGKLSPVIDTDLVDELENAGLKVYKNLARAYHSNAAYGPYGVGPKNVGIDDDVNYLEMRVNEVPWNEINNTGLGNVTDNVTEYEDAAIFVLSRYGGENLDLNFDESTGAYKSDNCYDGNYLDLSANEVDVLNHLQELKAQNKIKKIILVINACNALQFKNIQNFDIDACLWVGMGGNASFKQIANALTGKAVPSGRLVDTFVYDNYSAPATENFGDFTFTEYSDGLPENYKYSWNTKYLVYQEGIYVGYRYYETRYEDLVLGGRNADGSNGVKAGSGSWDYNDEVAYSFGYGLSYTDFAYSNYNVKDKGEYYEISVTVKNIGDTYSGKEVVQVYLQKPYTEYDIEMGIEKASVELVAFAKTNVLAPGAEQTLTMTVNKEEFKCYDSYGAKTYILEAGDYYLAAGKSAHDALNNILAAKGYNTSDGMDYNGNADFAHKVSVAKDDFDKYSVSSATGHKIVNLFDNTDINIYEGTADQKIVYLSRNNWDGTYPTPVLMKCLNEIMVKDMQYGVEPEVKEGDVMPVYGQTSEKYGPMTLVEMMDIDYYDTEMWDEFMNQTTWDEQVWLVTYGAHVIAGCPSVAAPGGLNHNGPSGLNQPNPTIGSQMAFPSEVNLASTFNTPLVEAIGDAFGMEMLHCGYTSLNGLGADIHRSAFSGRNWEYYSEDSYMTGVMLAAQSKGLQGRGIILFTKHLALNDQERNRYGVSTWANEQSIRELHVKGFEIAITTMDLNGIMSSFNRLGCVWAGRHTGLLTGLLRDEWGFTGAIETDAAVGLHMTDSKAMANAVCAGQDLWLMGGRANAFDDYKDNPTVALAVREAARRMLYAQLHANAMNGISSTTKIVRITPWWENAISAAKVILTALLILCAAFLVISIIANAMGGMAFTPQIIMSVIALALIGIFVAVCIVAPQKIFAEPDYGNTDTPTGGGATDGDGTEELPPPITHLCTKKCELCGGCLDESCTDDVCATKCGAGKTHNYVFEAENLNNELTPGSMNSISRVQLSAGKVSSATNQPVGYLGNFNSNSGASVTFKINSSANEVVNLSLGISANNSYTITDAILITVNGSDPLDRDAKVTKPSGGDWFWFVPVNLGCIELNEGENTITFTSIGGNGNIDNIIIKSEATLTYSNGDEADIADGKSNVQTPVTPTPTPTPDLPNINTSVDDSTWTSYEEFNAVVTTDGSNSFHESVEVSSKLNVSTKRPNADSIYPVGNLDMNKGQYVKFFINSTKAEKVGLYIELSNSASAKTLADWATLNVNGTDYTSNAALPVGDVWTPSDTYVCLGFIELKAGNNEITFTVNTTTAGKACNIYGLKFTSASAEITWGDADAPVEDNPSEDTNNINVSVDDSAWNVYEHFDAVDSTTGTFAEGIAMNTNGSSLIKTNRVNDRGVAPVGDIGTAVKYVTFYINSDKAEKVGLYMELSNRPSENQFNNWASLTVNDDIYTSDASMPTGSLWTPSNSYVCIGFVELKAGTNVITINITNSSVAHNIYGLKLTAESAVISWGTPVAK